MNDLELIPDGGDLQPYSSPSVPQPPAPDSGWSVPDADYLTENYQPGNAPQLFGQEIPNVTPQQAHQIVGEITDLFSADSVWQKGDRSFVHDIVNWYKENAFAPVPPRQYVNHSYDLRGYSFGADQPIITAFCNYCSEIGATQKQVKTALAWYAELIRRVNNPPQQQQHQSDTDWDQIEARCDADRQAGENELRNRWGHAYASNMALVQSYFDNLPQRERDHFSNAVLPGGVLALNSPDVVEGLYRQAIGANNLPSGGALQTEINQIENLMKSNRRAYYSDERLQARYRELLTRRDG